MKLGKLLKKNGQKKELDLRRYIYIYNKYIYNFNNYENIRFQELSNLRNKNSSILK